jgi:hypothetical protein
VSSTTPDHPTDTTPDDGPGAAPDPVAADDGAAGTAEEHVLVDPARVRRAPRYGAFLTVGAVVGLVAGLWLGTWLVGEVDPGRGDLPVLKPGVLVMVIAAATTTLAALLAGLLAVVADRRSLRGR